GRVRASSRGTPPRHSPTSVSATVEGSLPVPQIAPARVLRVRARRLRVARSSLLLGLVRTAARLAADGRLAVMLRSRLTAGRCLARPRSRPTVALRSRWAVVLGPGLASRGWLTGARPCARSGTALSPGARSGIRLPGPRPGLGRFEL